MIKFLKENGFPVDLEIESIPVGQNKEMHHIVYVNGKQIEKFQGFFRDRKPYARGFLKAYELLMKNEN